MRVLYLDCFAGIAGDMLLAALLDVGADLSLVRKGLSSLPIDGYTIETGKDESCGIAAT
ncbi:MAG TPA: LarC family nickel insertion protein [Syntrophomonadaceae bacterium]|nr:LarC family nickel insertion protein [Syntrophomonadaceae bacterium]